MTKYIDEKYRWRVLNSDLIGFMNKTVANVSVDVTERHLLQIGYQTKVGVEVAPNKRMMINAEVVEKIATDKHSYKAIVTLLIEIDDTSYYKIVDKWYELLGETLIPVVIKDEIAELNEYMTSAYLDV